MTYMHGAFDPQFQLRPGQAQPVGGPLFWDGASRVPPYEPVDTIAVHTVTVTQGDRVTVTPNTDFNAPADHWTATIRARSGTWVAGTAEVRVRVRLWPESLDSSPFEEAPWVETVKLVPA